MLCKAKGTGNIFGAFCANAWPSLREFEPEGKWKSIPDPRRKCFLFSLSNRHQRPLRFKLVTLERAMGVRSGDWGPLFGFGNGRNLQFMVEGKAADEVGGSWSVKGGHNNTRKHRAHFLLFLSPFLLQLSSDFCLSACC
jgi:hypothetical protein